VVAQTLKTLGYESVANLEGGITAGKEAGLPTAEHDSDF
jgi:rhodanese-related sulfurtransferase